MAYKARLSRNSIKQLDIGTVDPDDSNIAVFGPFSKGQKVDKLVLHVLKLGAAAAGEYLDMQIKAVSSIPKDYATFVNDGFGRSLGDGDVSNYIQPGISSVDVVTHIEIPIEFEATGVERYLAVGMANATTADLSVIVSIKRTKL